MKKPRKVKLFGYKIKVKWRRCPEEAEAPYNGRHLSHKRLIWVDKSCKGLGESLQHEVVHHISGQLGLKLGEEQVQALGTGLTEFIRLNPKVVRFIQESE